MGTKWGNRSRMFGIRRTVMVGTAVLAVCASGLIVSSTSGASTSKLTPKSKYPPIPAGPIKLGVSLALSGPDAQNGELTKTLLTNNFKYVFKYFGTKVDGHRLVLDFQNDQGSVTTGASVAEQFVADKVPIVLDTSVDPSVAPIQINILNKAHVITMNDAYGAPVYANTKTYPYLFDTAYNYAEVGTSGAAWLAKNKQYNKIAVLTDGGAIPEDAQITSALLNDVKAKDPGAKVVKEVDVSPSSIDLSAPLAQLRAAHPNLLLVMLYYDFGPVYSALQTMGWKPPILSTGNLFYSSYSALPKGEKTFVMTVDCASSAHETFPGPLEALMKSDAKLAPLPNQMIDVQVNGEVILLLKWAILKYDSVSPAALKKALETIGHHNGFFFHQWKWSFTPSDHAGFSGTWGPAVCNGSQLDYGNLLIPLKAS